MKALTKQEMAKLDDLMIRLGIDVPRMMEHAGLYPAMLTARLTKSKKILALTGTGNNGGDALVAARNLLNWGYSVDVAFASPKLKPVPLQQWKILKKMGVKETKKINWKKYGLIIDGLLGYNVKGDPRAKFAKLIDAANASKVPILAIDLPSGLDATSGKPSNPCVKASSTIALSAVKKGLLVKTAKKNVGNLYVAYMTVPDVVRRKFSLPRISEDDLIVRL